MLVFPFVMLYRPYVEFDVLSSVFTQLRLSASFQNAFDAGGRWIIEVPAHRGIKIHTILKGRCWLWLPDDPAPKELKAGDCYLLPRGSSFVVASHRSARKQNPRQKVIMRSNGGISTLNGGGDCLVSGVFFDFESPLGDVLFRSLPPIVIVPGASSQASELQINIRRFAAEFHGSGLGRSLIMYQLAPIMLIDIIRTHLSQESGNPSWFSALSESDLSRTLKLMHTEYERHWTLQELSVSVGVSRSKLAARFKSKVGIPPMEYLCRWRMEIARDMLANEGKSISEVSRLVGYESDSAFSATFKRIFNKRPGHYQRRNRPED